MSNETAKWIKVEQPATIEGEEVRETIDDITSQEPDIADHVGGNGEAEVLEDNASPEVAPGDNGKPEGNGKASTTKEGREEKFNRVFRETVEEITPLYQQAVTHTYEQRDHYRRIGLIVIKRRDEVSDSYGSKLIPKLAKHFGTSEWSLRAMADYAKVDPHGEAIPSALVNLSWRRVVHCAQRTKKEETFVEFLNGNPQLVTLGSQEFDKLLRETFPKMDTRGRKRKSEQLNTSDAQNQANGLGGTNDETTPPPEKKPLPENVAKAKAGLDEADSELSARVKVYVGENGFSFDATFKTETECITVFKHFIDHLEKEAV